MRTKRSFRPRHIGGFTLIEMLVVITILGMLIGLALPNLIRAKQKALEAQIKTNVHALRMDLERYASDHDGYYPAYLWGGSADSWCWDMASNAPMRAGCGAQGKVNPTSATVNQVLDPLIRYGYRSSYPKNPFISNNQSICVPFRNDPRFGCPIQAEFDSLMGNTMMDPNVPDSGFGDVNTIGYAGRLDDFFPAGDDEPTFDWIPGEFFYRSWSSRRDRAWCAASAGVPNVATPWPHSSDASYLSGQTPARRNCETDGLADYYILGGYGWTLTPGMDLVCDPVPPNPTPGRGCHYNPNTAGPPPADPDHYYGQLGGVNGQYLDSLPNVVFFDAWDLNNNGLLSGDAQPGASTYEVRPNGITESSQHPRSGYGNPDGTPDGIIIAFATGSPFQAAK